METWKAIIIGSLIIALIIIFSKPSDNHIKVNLHKGVVFYHDTKTKKTCYEPLTAGVKDDLFSFALLIKPCEKF